MFFLLIGLGVQENPSNYPKKLHFDKTQKSPENNHWEWHPPKKSHFDYINPENPRNKKKHVQNVTWVFPKDGGFPQNNHRLFPTKNGDHFGVEIGGKTHHLRKHPYIKHKDPDIGMNQDDKNGSCHEQ